jgi:hypothetical protein
MTCRGRCTNEGGSRNRRSQILSPVDEDRLEANECKCDDDTNVNTRRVEEARGVYLEREFRRLACLIVKSAQDFRFLLVQGRRCRTARVSQT